MRRLVEQAFELRTGGAPMIPWLMTQRSEGASLRELAHRLTELTGVSVSHESVRTWLRHG